MSEAVFLRLLRDDVSSKPDRLLELTQKVNAGEPDKDVFKLEPEEFEVVPGSPFSYWVVQRARQLFEQFFAVNSSGRNVKQGLATADDFQFVFGWWEIDPKDVINPKTDLRSKVSRWEDEYIWIPFAKGGTYSQFYSDVHLVVNWQNSGFKIKNRINLVTKKPYSNVWQLIGTERDYFYRPGLTWTLRTQKGFNARSYPTGSIFGHKGPIIFVASDGKIELSLYLGIVNSEIFKGLLKLQMAFGSYEVGVIQRTPVPPLDNSRLGVLALEAHDIKRSFDYGDEVTHAFRLPDVVAHKDERDLLSAIQAVNEERASGERRLADIQAEIDDIAFDLYGISEEDRKAILEDAGAGVSAEESDGEGATEDEDDDEDAASSADAYGLVRDLVMWCVGVAFGRWDVRYALEPGLLPALQGAFDPLPRVAPGGLVSVDGLPPERGGIAPRAWLQARANVLDVPKLEGSENTVQDGVLDSRENRVLDGVPDLPEAYPLAVDWDGVMVDDPDHDDDIVRRVRNVLEVVYAERADGIEASAYKVLGVKDLREYFRKRFFEDHIKRYSKSRRKAPIYWLLQSAKRNYALWVYYHRLTPDTFFKADTHYARVRLEREEMRLEEARAKLAGLDGAARKRQEKEVAEIESFITELRAFREALGRMAGLALGVDRNDGVLLSIAPLHELVPWREAKRAWDELRAGKYAWSTMSARMREKGLVR